MKLYLVIERDNEVECNDNVFGVFSTKEKATEIKEILNRNFLDHNETHIADIIELNLDETTDDYDFYLYN